MRTAKRATLELVQELPDEVSMDTILAELLFLFQIEQGLAEADRGETVSNEQVLKELRAWKSAGQ